MGSIIHVTFAEECPDTYAGEDKILTILHVLLTLHITAIARMFWPGIERKRNLGDGIHPRTYCTRGVFLYVRLIDFGKG